MGMYNDSNVRIMHNMQRSPDMNQSVDSGKHHITRAADSIVAELENRIFSGAFREGETLPAERELIEEFGTSRTVVREAVKILDSKGLIEALPRHRPVVKRPDCETVLSMLGSVVKHLIGQSGGVRQIFDLRILVEASLVRSAALYATKDDIHNLRAALTANKNCISDSNAFYDTDMAYHEVLYTIPKNPLLLAIHNSFTEWLDWHWRQMPRLQDRNARNYQSHEDIFNAILNRDPDEAEAALRGHLDNAWEQVQNTFPDKI